MRSQCWPAMMMLKMNIKGEGGMMSTDRVVQVKQVRYCNLQRRTGTSQILQTRCMPGRQLDTALRRTVPRRQAKYYIWTKSRARSKCTGKASVAARYVAYLKAWRALGAVVCESVCTQILIMRLLQGENLQCARTTCHGHEPIGRQPSLLCLLQCT